MIDEDDHWGVINDSGQWEVFHVGEEHARREFSKINYGKLVNHIRSDNRYNVVKKQSNPHD